MKEFLLAQWGGSCGICDKEFNQADKVCLDHDHKTGEIRGILCFSCNFAIGFFKDDLNIVRAALKYLDPDDRRSFA